MKIFWAILWRLLFAAAFSLPLAFVFGFLLTPILWKLEPLLGIELAGHSGPSDWVLGLFFGVSFSVLFLLMLWLWRRDRTKSPR